MKEILTVKKAIEVLSYIEDKEQEMIIEIEINGISIDLPIMSIGFSGQIRTKLKSKS